MEQRGCVIGADLGTTSAKAGAFDASGHAIARAEAVVPLVRDEDHAAEQEPEVVYHTLTRTLAETAQHAQQLGYTVERIGLSAAMHSLIPVAADGTPLMRALLWMDTRAESEAAALWDRPEGKAIYTHTGTPVHAMSPLAKLLWLGRHRPDMFQAAARFVSLKEWIWHHWFGEWRVDVSIASATGLYNLREQTWDPLALAVAGIDAGKLSALVPTTYVRHGTRDPLLAQAGISADCAFAICASDGVLANLGAGAIQPDAMVLTIGTSLAVRTGSPTPFTDAAARSFCYVLDTDRYIAGAPSNSGGVVLQWLAQNIVGGAAAVATESEQSSDVAALLAAAEHAEDDELLFLPFVAGERAPLWNGRASGVCFGLRLHHTAAHLMRAAVEGMIVNAYSIAARLFEALGAPERIVASGKVLEPAWIRQLVADVFALPVQYLGDVDASVLGAVALANIATGVWTWDDALRRPSALDQGTVQPAAPARYARKVERYRRLYDALTGDLADLYLGA